MVHDSSFCCVCGSAETKVVWRANLPSQIDASEFSYMGNKKYHGQVVRCRGCGHRFVHPLPVDSQMMYAQVIDDHYLNTEPQRQRTFEDFLDLKESFCPDRGTLLDIGCNTGVFLEVASRRGYEAEGIELSNWAVDIAQKRQLTVRQGALEDLAGINADFNTITAFDVIEHLSDPLKALTVARSLLSNNGCFIATVPDMSTWHAKLLGRHHWLVVLMHSHYFTRTTLSLLMLRAGFSKVQIVSAPPYRSRVVDAAKYLLYNNLLMYPGSVLSRIPFLKNLEIRLKASLFCVAWK